MRKVANIVSKLLTHSEISVSCSESKTEPGINCYLYHVNFCHMGGLNLNLHEAVSLDFRLKCVATLVCTLTKVTEFSSWTNPLIVRPKVLLL